MPEPNTATEEQKTVVAGAGGSEVTEQEAEKQEGEPEAKAKTASESGTDTEEERKRKSGWQRRVDKLTSRAQSAEEALELERRESARLREQLAGKPASADKKAGTTEEEDPEPKEDDFKDYKSFTKAMAQWAARQESKSVITKAKTSEAQQAEASRQEKAYNEHLERIETVREKYEDWDDIADGLKNSEMPNGAVIAIVESEDGPDIMYHLATHPEVFKKLQGMSDVRAASEIGRISASLAANPPKPVKAPTTPRPPKPVGGGPTRAAVDLSKASLSDYMQQRSAGRRR